MTKYFMTLVLALACALTLTAQTTPNVRTMANTGSDVDYSQGYEKMINNMYKVEMRKIAIEALDLEEGKQTSDFTRLYMNYMREKDNLMERRKRLIRRYNKEMAEDDREEDEREETADFIENFLEENINELELQKDYFDDLEDKIGYEKALQFLAMEDMFAQRARRKMVMDMLPDMVMLVPVRSSYQATLNDYNNWNRLRINGEVSLGHEYTKNGLTKLWNAAEQMTRSEGISVANFSQKKQKVMALADKMQENWKSLTHADMAREAFQITANTLGEIARDSRFNVSEQWINKLSQQARAINKDKKLTDQGPAVDGFFNTAQYIVNDLAEQANAVR